MKTSVHLFALVSSLGMISVLVSCSSSFFKAKPPQPTAFLSGPPVLQHQHNKSPFAITGGSLSAGASQIYIAPVTLDYLSESVTIGDPLRSPFLNQRKMAEKLAPVLRQEFIAAFARSPSSRYRIALWPSSDSLILQLALTEVRTTGFDEGLARLAMAEVGLPESLIPELKPCIAIEGRLIDPTSGGIIYKFADRQESPDALIPVDDLLSFEAHFRSSIRRWAMQFEKLTRGDVTKTRDSSIFNIF